MNIKQISVFIENKPGRLQNVLEVLNEAEINILTLTIAEINDFGILRLIVDKPGAAHDAFHKENITSTVNDVLGVGIDDNPGGLLRLINCFTANNLNIEYMYAFTRKRGDKAAMIFRFEDIESAKELLLKEGFDVMKKIDIIGDQE